jgi:hypothetical protein
MTGLLISLGLLAVSVFASGFVLGCMITCNDGRCKLHKWTDSWPHE